MFQILFILFFTSISYINASIYKIIPPCSYCETLETKLLSTTRETEFFELLEVDTVNLDSENKWNLDKSKNPHRLKINYKDSFNIYFEKLLIIEEEVNKYNHRIDFELDPKLLTLYLYTPSANGLSKRDFKLAFGISKAMSEKNNNNNNNDDDDDDNDDDDDKEKKLSFSKIEQALAAQSPEWQAYSMGGRNISKNVSCSSFSEAIAIITAISSFSELEDELQKFYYTEGLITITLQRQISKSVYQSTLDLAINIDQLILNLRNNA